MKTGLVLFGIIAMIAFAILFPFLVIWALNTLFGLAIGYSLETWSAVVLLQMFLNINVTAKVKK